MPSSSRVALAALVAAPLAVVAAGASSAGTTRSLEAYGLTAANELVSFTTDATADAVTRPVTGLAAGELLVGIDFRPANGTLVGLVDGATDRLVTIDPATAAATALSTLSVQLVGGSFGIDFNPTVDRLRVVSDAEQNLRINVDTGAVTVDGPLAYAAGDADAGTDPAVVAAAYTNNDTDTGTTGATGTARYDLDAALDSLVLQAPPNNGTLTTVGALDRPVGAEAGFDIYSDVTGGRATTNTAYAVLAGSGVSKLVTVDLATGLARPAGVFRPSVDVVDIAVATVQA